MAAHLDHGPVPQEAFDALMKWLTTTWDTVPEYPGLSDKELYKKRNSTKLWLENLQKGTWPTGPKEYKVFVCGDGQEDYYKGLSTQARACLAIASRVLGFRYEAQTMREGQEFRVAWGNAKGADSDEAETRSVKQIEWLRVPYPCTFSDLVLLGASSMAEALGVDLRVRDLQPDHDHVKESRAVVDELEGTENVEDTQKSTVFVLELADATSAARSRRGHLSKYRVVTTGPRGATVSQDDAAIGIQLAEAAIDCQSSSKTCSIAIIAPYANFELGGHQDRVLAFERYIAEAAQADPGKKYKVEKIGVKCEGYMHSHELCRLLSDKKSADCILGHDVVFAVTGAVAEGFLQSSHHLPQRKMPKVFSADLAPSLINLMREPDSPLEAICGVEPFSYGRLIVRAACDTSLTGSIKIPPFRVTRSYVMNADIRNYALLVAKNPALQLSGAEFAWQPWMRDLCPFSERDE